MNDNVDVLIAGAGPVGLLLAAELARDGVETLIVDSMASRAYFSKALGITARTLEIFDDLGIVHEAIDHGIWMEGVTAYHNGELAAEMTIPDVLPFGALSLAQPETERLLERCLHSHGGAVQYGWALTDFREDADGVEVTLESAQGEQRTVRSRWLVGCDGAHSKVRSLLGLPFEGGRYPQTFALADVEVDWDLPRGRMYRFSYGTPGQTGGQMLAVVPVRDASGRRYRLSTVVPDDQAGGENEVSFPGLEEVVTLMSPLLPEGTKLSHLQWSSVYRVSHRIVSEYSRGRVFLAGDAAHLHPPVGGQGMNTGLQDAHNLAWKLAHVQKGLAADSLLASYSGERHPVGLDVVENTSRALNDVLANKLAQPGMRETQLLIAYRDSSIVRDDRENAGGADLAAGDRAPDLGGLRRPYVEQSIRLHELLGKGKLVLLTNAQNGPELQTLLQETLGEDAAAYAIIPKDAAHPSQEALPFLIDEQGHFATEYGLTCLIRPDGYIGWCSAAPTVASLREYLAVLLGR